MPTPALPESFLSFPFDTAAVMQGYVGTLLVDIARPVSLGYWAIDMRALLEFLLKRRSIHMMFDGDAAFNPEARDLGKLLNNLRLDSNGAAQFIDFRSVELLFAQRRRHDERRGYLVLRFKLKPVTVRELNASEARCKDMRSIVATWGLSTTAFTLS
jgi:hypothetical protein